MFKKEIDPIAGTEVIVEMSAEEVAAFMQAAAQDEALRQQRFDALPYADKRALEYPPITDYLDGVVKGDQAQIDKYISDCLAVKAKYPKT